MLGRMGKVTILSSYYSSHFKKKEYTEENMMFLTIAVKNYAIQLFDLVIPDY